ncbi:pentatricopeptide repeat-containing protein At1g08070, chloroplastic [Carica papaya]|uniref:pentatricopeptide repeat-containing protein At1g08070, chloroplastic n=1 Tax=Carica papaya TaxID=3649 RepID=UPI000B8CD577|nr:pentatricopeptide repeat-containing protein At1g08070, chloroplastic [Carica papaya]
MYLVSSCKSDKHLHQVQTQIITSGFEQSDYIAPGIVAVCGQLKKLAYAHKVFDRITQPNVSLWNAMFKSYAQNERYREVIVLFSKMIKMDVMPNCFTFPIVLKSCLRTNAIREGVEVHCFVIKGGFRANQFVGTALIDMYSGGELIGAAYRVFSEMIDRNVVAWTSMINGYILCGDIVSARRLFELAPERDVVLWNTMISGYIESWNMAEASKLFDQMPMKDVMSWNTVLNGYANNGDIEACERLFEKMPERNVFSWNGLIGGYARNGRFCEVLDAFTSMLVDKNVLPNDATLVAVLSACARLGSLDLGKWIHIYAEKNGYKGNVYVTNALIDMYAKCGAIEIALYVFKGMERKDLISWNTIITGLAMHGHGAAALSLFHEMKNVSVKPDGITFIGVLCACTHMGLVDDGLSYFQSMVDDCSIVPQIEHYGCLVDLLSRAGLLVQAVEFVKKMPMEADAIIWAALLGACRVYKNVELAELALQHLIQLEPKNPANFVMLSNLYGHLGRWKDVARLKVAMRDTGFKKLPGCSLIEVNDTLFEFYSLDERHPKTETTYRTLRGLTKLLRSSGYVPDLKELGQEA